MNATADERRRAMDDRMSTVMANHATILDNQSYITQQLGHQHDCTEALKREIEESRVVLTEIKAIMSTLYVMSTLTRWGVVVAAASLSVWQAIKAMFTFLK